MIVKDVKGARGEGGGGVGPDSEVSKSSKKTKEQVQAKKRIPIRHAGRPTDCIVQISKRR